jgi:hypothetical protein
MIDFSVIFQLYLQKNENIRKKRCVKKFIYINKKKYEQ